MVGCLFVCVDLSLHGTVCGYFMLRQKSVCKPQAFNLKLLAPVDDFLQYFVFFHSRSLPWLVFLFFDSDGDSVPAFSDAWFSTSVVGADDVF